MSEAGLKIEIYCINGDIHVLVNLGVLIVGSLLIMFLISTSTPLLCYIIKITIGKKTKTRAPCHVESEVFSITLLRFQLVIPLYCLW
jgi:hypothetical protein